MEANRDREDFEDKIREDIRQEIMQGSGARKTSKGNRYKEQIAELELESAGAIIVHKSPVKEKEVTTIIDDSKKETKSFLKSYLQFCGILAILSVIFLGYVWRSISLYETTRPERILDAELQDLQAGESADNIVFPELAKNEFSNEEEMKDGYLESLQQKELSYQFVKDDYQTGEKIYSLLADEDAVAKITLQTVSEQTRLGFLHIAKMEIAKIEPVMDIATWSYDIAAWSTDQVFVNDIQVSDKYLQDTPSDLPEFKYLYEYVSMPKKVVYHIDGIYQEAQIKILDENGKEVEYESEGNQVKALLAQRSVDAQLAPDIANEIDVLHAAETWSLFTTRDLQGNLHGLDQVRQYFIKDSYYWQKLEEYAKGIDITLVSDHNSSSTYFEDEAVTDYRAYGETCFSCKIHFEKHMQLAIGREQVDITDSIFYFVKRDDTEDGVDNATWKIADIQAVVNPSVK